MSSQGISRRELFRRGGLLGGLLALPGWLRGQPAAATKAASTAASVAGAGLRVGPDIYRSIGARPWTPRRSTTCTSTS